MAIRFGVPTVGGEVEFDERYNGNILVNAFAAGLADTDKIFYSKAEGVGLPVVYLGAKTGRDGVGGATMASAEFGDDIEEKRPTVQVGDPFTEKRLLEACLELMATGAVIAIQDMGAAGLTCSAVEMGAKGDLGIELDLDKVPVREEAMTPYEMMLSAKARSACSWCCIPKRKPRPAPCSRSGSSISPPSAYTTDDLRFRVMWKGEEVANLPIKDLGDAAPGIRPAVDHAGAACAARRRRHSADGHRRRAAAPARLARALARGAGSTSSTTR